MENTSNDVDIFGEKDSELVESPITDESNVMQEDSHAAPLLSRLKFAVSIPHKIAKSTSLKKEEATVNYLIESSPRETNTSGSEGNEITSLWRRYNEFELLHNYLVITFPAVVIPPLPEKRPSYIWAKIAAINDDDINAFCEKQKIGLERFLNRLAQHPKLCTDKFLVDFICKQENWRSSVSATNFQEKQDSWLKKMNASLRVRNLDIRFEQLKAYSNQLQASSSALLKLRAKVAQRVFGIYKIHANYSRVFKQWALIEQPPLREALEKAATEVDVWTNSIDALVDEEDLIAERLKEYLYFADSLKTIHRKHEAMQYDVEWYEDQIKLNNVEKSRLQSGKLKSFSLSGMKARLMGPDTPEQIQVKVQQLDKTIATLHELLERHRSSASEFLEEALQEVEVFKARKSLDLKEIFTSYTELQIKVHKKGSDSWSRLKSLFGSVTCDQAK